jgi:hypothetical protein
MPVTAIVLHNLRKAEVLELGEHLSSDAFEVEEQPTPEGAFGELALATAIVFASAAGLKAFVAYLAHSRRGDEIDEEIEVEHADGRRERRRLRVKRRSTDPIDSAVAEELSTITGIPQALLLPDPA